MAVTGGTSQPMIRLTMRYAAKLWPANSLLSPQRLDWSRPTMMPARDRSPGRRTPGRNTFGPST
jgi:hypothetical protein